MRRRTATDPTPALAALERMMRAQDGLRLLLTQLPPGSTLADARRVRERIAQEGRRPCRMLERALGIDRD